MRQCSSFREIALSLQLLQQLDAVFRVSDAGDRQLLYEKDGLIWQQVIA